MNTKSGLLAADAARDFLNRVTASDDTMRLATFFHVLALQRNPGRSGPAPLYLDMAVNLKRDKKAQEVLKDFLNQ